jgi:head-tail adaptor
MAIESRFRHDLVIERLGASTGTTPRGHAIRALADHHATRGLVEETTGREIEGPELGETVVTNVRIFAAATEDVTEADVVRRVDVDPPRRYEVLFVRDPGGRGRHLELDARRVAP